MMCEQVLVLLGLLILVSLPNTLGIQNEKINKKARVIDGTDAPEGLYPYQVSLRIKDSGSYSASDTTCYRNFKKATRADTSQYGYHTCGASIISSDYVLTAAHCVAYKEPKYFLVVVGSTKLDTGGDVYAVTEIHWNTEFSMWNGQHDIAVMKVSPSFTFYTAVNLIPLEANEIPCPELVVLTGWGFSDRTTFSANNQLQHIQLETYETNACNSKHSMAVTENQICTFNEYGAGACKGDSGGPLVIIDESGTITQIGIVSSSDDCKIGSPDVYTKVSKYLPWIREKCNNCV